MKFILIFILLFTINIFSQTDGLRQYQDTTDWQKWGKANFTYQLQKPSTTEQRNYSLKGENLGGTILRSFADAYWFFISDVDGDNCSFNPTCSNFFVQAVKRTNILQGTLMFADRFTRDLNLFKLNHYPRVEDGHFYDPVSLYTLNQNNIKIIPPESFVNTE
jgi:putative component of membrane protein insertase Oxa1/YidC/SpoIIIJ protein YidD